MEAKKDLIECLRAARNAAESVGDEELAAKLARLLAKALKEHAE